MIVDGQFCQGGDVVDGHEGDGLGAATEHDGTTGAGGWNETPSAVSRRMTSNSTSTTPDTRCARRSTGHPDERPRGPRSRSWCVAALRLIRKTPREECVTSQASVRRVCPAGHENPVGNAFCAACGAPMAPSASGPGRAGPATADGLSGRPAAPRTGQDPGQHGASPINALVVAGAVLGLAGPLVRLALFTVQTSFAGAFWPLEFGYAPGVSPRLVDSHSGSALISLSGLGLLSLLVLAGVLFIAVTRHPKTNEVARIAGIVLLVLMLVGFALGSVDWNLTGNWSQPAGALLVELGSAVLILAGSFWNPLRLQPSPLRAGAANSTAGGVPVATTSSSDTMSVWALVLSAVGLVVCLPIAIVGLVMGHVARARLRAAGSAPGGGGLATAAIVVGWIAVALWVLGVIAYVALVASTT